MKAIILEDEQLAVNRFKRLLKEVAPDVQIAATFESIQDTTKYLKSNKDIDILFLDIHVADGNSFELFELSEISGKVVFTTAYDRYAIEAFRKNATDYLLKPIKKKELAEAIFKASPKPSETQKEKTNEFKSRIMIKFMSKIHSLKVSDIAYIYSKNKISYFYTFDGKRYPSDFKLQDLENELNPTQYFRANRQFIISIEAIDELLKHQASRIKILLNPPIDKDVIVSTDKTPFFKKWLER